MDKYCMHCMAVISEEDTECPFCGKALSGAVMPHHLLPGTLLNKKYIVGYSIGEGGFGITYIGRDETLDMKVAIKEYYPNGYVNRSNTISPNVNSITSEDGKEFFAKGRERFLREARMLAKFSAEPGIVEVRDCFEANNTSYIIMEYLDGETLKDYLKRKGTLTPEAILTLMMPVMLSLKKVHEQKLIHRDISPDNIMIVGDKVKLLDFGAARNVTSVGNKSLSVMLKPGYAPEEQYRSKGDQGPWTDIYALCATMYKCITGITPDDSTQRVHNDELKAPSAMNISINADFEYALMKGLSVLQKDRYHSIEELIAGMNGTEKKTNDDKTVTISGIPVSEDDKATEYIDNKKTAYPSKGASSFEANKNQPVTDQSEKEDKKTARKNQQRATPKLIIGIVLILFGLAISGFFYLIPSILAIAAGVLFIVFRNKKIKLTKKKVAVAALSSALVIVAIVAVVIIFNSLNTVTICGEPVSKSKAYVNLFQKNVTKADMSSLSALEELETLTFSSCSFEEGAVDHFRDFKSHLSELNLSLCSGIADYSNLSGLKYLKKLTISGCSLTNEQIGHIDLSGMEYLTEINLGANDDLTDISLVSGVSDTLMKIFVNNTAVTDLSPLSECAVLQYVNADGNGISDISVLTNKTITELSLNYNNLTDISVVSNYELFSYFSASNNSLSDISPLAGHKALRNVDLHNNHISEISCFSTASSLNSLNISDNHISSLSALSHCELLKNLYANNNQLTDLNGLEHSLELSVLQVVNNKIANISGLTNCTVLKECNFNNNAISDILLLKKNSATLRSLYFNNNQVSDISALENTTALEYLSFDNNSVTSLDALTSSTNLSGISGEHNQITSISGLQNSTKLKHIYLSHNSIESISVLSNLVSRADKDFAVIDLSSNNISEISLSSEKGISYFAIYNNPITSLANTKNIQGTCLLFTYVQDINLSDIARAYSHYKVIDCPLDKQVEAKKGLGEYKVSFISAEEADQETQNAKIVLLTGSLSEDSEETTSTN